MPPESRNSTQENGFASVIALNNPSSSHTWPKEGKRLMGQPATVQVPPTLTSRPESFSLAIDHFTNPYEYTIADNFNNAVIEAQNDLNMPLANIKAIEIESKDCKSASSPPWWA